MSRIGMAGLVAISVFCNMGMKGFDMTTDRNGLYLVSKLLRSCRSYYEILHDQVKKVRCHSKSSKASTFGPGVGLHTGYWCELNRTCKPEGLCDSFKYSWTVMETVLEDANLNQIPGRAHLDRVGHIRPRIACWLIRAAAWQRGQALQEAACTGSRRVRSSEPGQQLNQVDCRRGSSSGIQNSYMDVHVLFSSFAEGL